MCKRARPAEASSPDELRIIVVDEAVPVPEHLKGKRFPMSDMFPTNGRSPDKQRGIVYSLMDNESFATPPTTHSERAALQSRICDVLCVNFFTACVSLLKGRVPDDVILTKVLEEEPPWLVWFAETTGGDIVPVNISKWEAMPGVCFMQLRCIHSHVRHTRAKEALSKLREILEGLDLMEETLRVSMGHLKIIYDSM